tara:strand:- start:1572 stop:1985 length:414 start_codon:yes stop_codon:yes gene_type:complete
MIKKVLVVGLFLGGGYLFIKKILPSLVGKSKSLDIDTMSADEIFAQKEKERAEFEKKMRDTFQDKFGTRNPENYSDSELLKKMMFAPDINFDNLTPEQIASISNTLKNNSIFPNGLTYDPNNLNSFKGLEGWTLNMF